MTLGLASATLVSDSLLAANNGGPKKVARSGTSMRFCFTDSAEITTFDGMMLTRAQ